MNIGPLHLGIAEGFAVLGAVFAAATYAMQTMVPLRIAGIINVFFILFGYFSQSYPTLFLYLLLLPLNAIRLRQMVQLVKNVKLASAGDLSMEWLKPFMTKRQYFAGDILFHKGDTADEMFFTVTGKFLLPELGIELGAGALVGELGLLAPENRRTATLECLEGGDVLTLNYDKVRELYFQNPQFGFYFLKLTSERLLQNIARLEARLENKQTAAAATAGH
jgi:hypothetical protein